MREEIVQQRRKEYKRCHDNLGKKLNFKMYKTLELEHDKGWCKHESKEIVENDIMAVFLWIIIIQDINIKVQHININLIILFFVLVLMV